MKPVYPPNESVIHSHDPLVRALEKASDEEVILFIIALARLQGKDPRKES